jgi:hypothetical protein
MSNDPSIVWLLLLLLGAVHGVNPGMGWLFAVALGLQERSGRAVWGALLPLALGHFLAIGAAILLGTLLGLVIPVRQLKWVVAATLLTFGVYRLFRHRHPRFGGMRVGMLDLTIWSLLMASAHGAGLMVLPLVLQGEGSHVEALHAAPADPPVPTAMWAEEHRHAAGPRSDPGGHGAHLSVAGVNPASGLRAGLAATLIHTSGYLLVTALIALVVYRKLGLRLLRSAWINLDLIWAGALILTALLTPLV